MPSPGPRWPPHCIGWSRATLSSVKPVGQGVAEYRIDFGPGYRIYIGQDGEMLIILLGGGTKKRQSADIQLARQRWQEYKARKQR